MAGRLEARLEAFQLGEIVKFIFHEIPRESWDLLDSSSAK